MSGSILDEVKQVLGLRSDYLVFDLNLMIYINMAFSTLNQLGLGPDEGFAINDSSATWDTFVLDESTQSSVKAYVSLRTKELFDPPQSAAGLQSLSKVIQEQEWRLSVRREDAEWTAPTPS